MSKSAVITGGASGIGAALGSALVQRGVDVVPEVERRGGSAGCRLFELVWRRRLKISDQARR